MVGLLGKFAALFLAAIVFLETAAAGELAFSSQRSLLLPDPFIKKRAVVKSQTLVCKGENCVHAVTSTARNKLNVHLVDLIKAAETHFGKSAQIASGCRSDSYNEQVGGAPRSYHLSCDAADLIIPGVTVHEAKLFFKNLPGVGGIGTYCYLSSIHIDVGPVRRWHRGCVEPGPEQTRKGKSIFVADFDLHD